jgi:hypothetical protein
LGNYGRGLELGLELGLGAGLGLELTNALKLVLSAHVPFCMPFTFTVVCYILVMMIIFKGQWKFGTKA